MIISGKSAPSPPPPIAEDRRKPALGGLEGPHNDATAQSADDEAAFELRCLTLCDAQHGLRLDRALAEVVPEFSRSYLQQILREGCVRLNEECVTKNAQRVKAGDRLEITLRPTAQSQAFKPQAMALDVVFSDEHLMVLHKPAGLVVHPAPGNWSGTLLNGLLAHHASARLLPRAGIVHRLDKDTSGLMIIARTRTAMDALIAMIGARQVHRQYLAMAYRHWSGPATLQVQQAIGRDPRNRLRMAVVDLARHSGKPAITGFQLLHNSPPHASPEGCLVCCTLHTGRTHQIRVHMAHMRHPLLADTLYGGAPALGLTRQALHAQRLSFQHPMTGAAMDFQAPLPADMQYALDAWALRYNPVQPPACE